MAQYKVPQDVEAEDKLLGPFTFRLFVYLMIAGGLIAVGVFFVLHNLVFLVIFLAPPVILLLVLALPLRKDQPMETYLVAVLSFYLKPHTRIWEPGEPESTIIITAPKKTDEIRTKDLDQDEAMHRLSFLADIVDTEGYAIKDSMNSSIRADVIAEANSTVDMFEDNSFSSATISQTLQNNAQSQHQEMVNQMRAAIEKNNQPISAPVISHDITPASAPAPAPVAQPAPVFTTTQPIPTSTPVAPTSAPAPAPLSATPAPTFGTLDDDNTAAVQTAIFTTPEEPPALPDNPFATSAPADIPGLQPVPVATPPTTPAQQPVTPATPAPTSTFGAITPATPEDTPSMMATPDIKSIIEENPLNDENVATNDTIIKPDENIVYHPAEEKPEQVIDDEVISDDSIATAEPEPAPEAAPVATAESEPEPEDIPTEPEKPDPVLEEQPEPEPDPQPSQDIIDLANNPDFSIETIAKQAKRINEKSNDKEVYISLH